MHKHSVFTILSLQYPFFFGFIGLGIFFWFCFWFFVDHSLISMSGICPQFLKPSLPIKTKTNKKTEESCCASCGLAHWVRISLLASVHSQESLVWLDTSGYETSILGMWISECLDGEGCNYLDGVYSHLLLIRNYFRCFTNGTSCEYLWVATLNSVPFLFVISHLGWKPIHSGKVIFQIYIPYIGRAV